MAVYLCRLANRNKLTSPGINSKIDQGSGAGEGPGTFPRIVPSLNVSIVKRIVPGYTSESMNKSPTVIGCVALLPTVTRVFSGKANVTLVGVIAISVNAKNADPVPNRPTDAPVTPARGKNVMLAPGQTPRTLQVPA